MNACAPRHAAAVMQRDELKAAARHFGVFLGIVINFILRHVTSL